MILELVQSFQLIYTSVMSYSKRQCLSVTMCTFCKVDQAYTIGKQENGINMIWKLHWFIYYIPYHFSALCQLLNPASHERTQCFTWYPQSTAWIRLENSSNLNIIITYFTILLSWVKWQPQKDMSTSHFLEPVSIALFEEKHFCRFS